MFVAEEAENECVYVVVVVYSSIRKLVYTDAALHINAVTHKYIQ